ncbi:MAG: sensor histidine kinase [Actinopolymorphaceae bacterium]
MMKIRRGTVGLRFTILYAAVFLASGVGLLVLAFLLSGGSVSSVAPAQNPPAGGDLAAAQERIRSLQDQLAEVHAQQSRQLLIGSLLALVVMVAVSVLLGRALAGRVLRPLRMITASTRRITAENLDQRLAVSGPADEVKDLADTIDDLLQRLETSFTAQRRFVANASHELRTPLATIRASLDVAVAKPGPAVQTVALTERLRGQLDQIDHLLDGFLVLARVQHGALSDLVPVECGELISQAVSVRADGITAKGLRVVQDVRPDTWTAGNPALLTQMIENVVDNSILHNEQDGWIRIQTLDDGAEVRLVVETGGRVLDQADVDRLAQPFERLGADRTGTEAGSGLGLSIVAAIAAAHGGRLCLLARGEGGLRVTIVLLAVPAPVEVTV